MPNLPIDLDALHAALAERDIHPIVQSAVGEMSIFAYVRWRRPNPAFSIGEAGLDHAFRVILVVEPKADGTFLLQVGSSEPSDEPDEVDVAPDIEAIVREIDARLVPSAHWGIFAEGQPEEGCLSVHPTREKAEREIQLAHAKNLFVRALTNEEAEAIYAEWRRGRS